MSNIYAPRIQLKSNTLKILHLFHPQRNPSWNPLHCEEPTEIMSSSVQTDISPISKQLYIPLQFIFQSTMKCLSIYPRNWIQAVHVTWSICSLSKASPQPRIQLKAIHLRYSTPSIRSQSPVEIPCTVRNQRNPCWPQFKQKNQRYQINRSCH